MAAIGKTSLVEPGRLCYAHWLSPSYFDPRVLDEHQDRMKLVDRACDQIKLHALLGSRFVLSDVMIVDSLPVLKLFADPHFQQFLIDNPNFFSLKANPALGHGGVALAGLGRCVASGWSSSGFPQKERATQKIAECILNDRDILSLDDTMIYATEPIAQVLSDLGSEHARLLRAMLQAVRFFYNNGKCTYPTDTIRGGKTLYDMLEAAHKGDRLHKGKETKEKEETRDIIWATIGFLNDLGEEGRVRQSVAFDKLKDRPDGAVRTMSIRRTITHAWNAAIQDSLSPSLGSIGQLRGSAPVGLYLDDKVDSFLVGERSSDFVGQCAKILWRWDLSKLGWDKIADTVKATKDGREQLQAVLIAAGGAYNDRVEQATVEHAAKVAEYLQNRMPQPRRRGQLLALAQGVLVAIENYTGHPILLQEKAMAGGALLVFEEAAHQIDILGRKASTVETFRQTVREQQADVIHDR